MPLYDNSWERGKCAFKLIQYMASFLPVVASNVGMNSEIINNDSNGFVVSSSQQWSESLMKIYYSNELREKMGKNGRKLVEQKFTIQSRINEFENFIN
jgi:glycosyltransferase involved in cell wall biosynthesis